MSTTSNPRQRGLTLIELLIGSLITIVISAGVFALTKRMWDNHEAIISQNLVQRQAKTALDIVCDELRSMYGMDPRTYPPTPAFNNEVIDCRDNSNPFTGITSEFTQVESSLFYEDHKIKREGNVLTRSDNARQIANRPLNPNRVNNITQFRVQYQRRVPMADGSFAWQSMPNQLAANPSVSAILDFTPTKGNATIDNRLNHVERAIITITATHQAGNGVTFSRTLQGVVRLRNNFFTLVPPPGW